MACTQTLAGLAKDCDANMGGIVEIYAANFADVTAITLTSGKVSAITMDTGKKFKTYSLPRNTAYLTSTLNVDQAAGTKYYVTELFMQVNKMDTTKRTEIEALKAADLRIIAKDGNGAYWLLGYDFPVNASASTAESGTAAGDHNGYNMTFQEESPILPYEVDSSIVAALLA